MNVYLVRDGDSGIIYVTLSKERAIALLKIRVEKLAEQLPNAERKKFGPAFKSKIYYESISWHEYWIQQHQIHESPLEILAAQAEDDK